MRATPCRWCVIMMIVESSSVDRIESINPCSVAGSSPQKGSSRTTTGTCASRMRASAILWRSPGETTPRLIDHRVEAVRKTVEQIGQPHLGENLLQLRIRRVKTPDEKIVAQRLVEQMRPLMDDPTKREIESPHADASTPPTRTEPA